MRDLAATTSTMSSREIAELTGKDHKHVLTDVRNMCESLKIQSAEFSAQYKDSTGRTLPCFNLPKRETLTEVSKMLNRTTINARIKRGMTREEAENTPLLIDKKLTLQKVLEVEAHGLSLSDSAYLLRVTPQRLGRFVKSHGIEWRGKKHCYKYGVDPDSQRQTILASGLPESTVYARMYRKNLTIEEAIAFKSQKKECNHE